MPQTFFRDFTRSCSPHRGAVRKRFDRPYALLAVIKDCTTATSRVLEMYDVTPEIVAEELECSVGDDFPFEYRSTCSTSARRRIAGKEVGHPPGQIRREPHAVAGEGKLDPVVAREHEIERVVQNPFAPQEEQPDPDRRSRRGQAPPSRLPRMARGEVPDTIADKTLFARRPRRPWRARSSAASSRSACSS
ncbi:MAG: hypothetical protein V8Q54_02590 [Alistipes senegalensis]